MTNNPKSRDQQLVVQKLGQEVLIYDLSVNKAYNLNEISAIIWELCDGTNSVAEIAEELSKQLKMKVGDEIIWLALDNLKKDNLLADSEQVTIEFNGLSRRQIIRRIGLASLIALPVISAMIVPSAAHASSTGAVTLAACTPAVAAGTSTQCQSGNCYNTRSNGSTNGNPVAATGNTKCCYPGAAGSQNRDTGNSFGNFASPAACAGPVLVPDVAAARHHKPIRLRNAYALNRLT